MLRAIMWPGDGNAQPSRHRMDALRVIKRARSLHAKRVDDPYLPGVMGPGDQHRCKGMTKAEVDADDPPGIERDVLIRIESLEHGGQQFQWKHRTGAELRRALHPRLALVLGITGGEFF